MLFDKKLQPGIIEEIVLPLSMPSICYFGHRIEFFLLEKIAQYDFDKLFFITEKNTYDLHGHHIFQLLKNKFKHVYLNKVPQGEQCKRFSTLERLCEKLIGQKITKKSILIAFGGGTVGNLVGLTAGLMYRGIRLIQVPTTFISQTDGTLSNKQAINGCKGKNIFGLYHAPIFTLTDTNYLLTESYRLTRSGIVEGVKNGFISNPVFLESLHSFFQTHRTWQTKHYHNLAYQILMSKIDILQLDPTEKEYGLILEYGHTFGHAIEWLMKGKMLHGEAVSLGMLIAAEMSHALGFLSAQEVSLHYEIIVKQLGLSAKLPKNITINKLLDTMMYDNKKTTDTLRFVLLEKIGKCANKADNYLVTVDNKVVINTLQQFIQ